MNTKGKRAVVGLAALVMIFFFSTGAPTKEAFAMQEKEPCNISASENNDLKAELINTKEWAVSDITEIQAIYNTDSIRVMPSETQNIVLKEYLSENDPQFYARTSITDSILKIENGSRPHSKSSVSNIEIYVPAGFQGTINLNAEKLGSLTVENLTAAKFILRTNNGDIRVTNSNGDLDCETRIGRVTVAGGGVTGTLSSRNGSIVFRPDKISGDVQVTSKLGFIKATLPQDSSFILTATTKMNDIVNKFSDTWTVSEEGFTQTLNATWGTEPTSTVSLNARMEKIEITAK